MNRARVGAAALVLSLAGGCGGGSAKTAKKPRTPKERYAAEVSAVCSAANKRMIGLPRAQGRAERGVLFSQLAAIVRDQAAALRGLAPSPADRQTADALAVAMDREAAGLDGLSRALAADSAAQYRSALAFTRAAYNRASGLAGGYGVRACGLPRSFTGPTQPTTTRAP